MSWAARSVKTICVLVDRTTFLRFVIALDELPAVYDYDAMFCHFMYQ